MPQKNYPDENGRVKNSFDPEDYTNCAAIGECTGLIPSAPHEQEEYESYDDVYNFIPHAQKKTQTD